MGSFIMLHSVTSPYCSKFSLKVSATKKYPLTKKRHSFQETCSIFFFMQCYTQYSTHTLDWAINLANNDCINRWPSNIRQPKRALFNDRSLRKELLVCGASLSAAVSYAARDQDSHHRQPTGYMLQRKMGQARGTHTHT